MLRLQLGGGELWLGPTCVELTWTRRTCAGQASAVMLANRGRLTALYEAHDNHQHSPSAWGNSTSGYARIGAPSSRYRVPCDDHDGPVAVELASLSERTQEEADGAREV
jgi:hypothetical protein